MFLLKGIVDLKKYIKLCLKYAHVRLMFKVRF